MILRPFPTAVASFMAAAAVVVVMLAATPIADATFGVGTRFRRYKLATPAPVKPAVYRS
jgi:hypothetical protein